MAGTFVDVEYDVEVDMTPTLLAVRVRDRTIHMSPEQFDALYGRMQRAHHALNETPGRAVAPTP